MTKQTMLGNEIIADCMRQLPAMIITAKPAFLRRSVCCIEQEDCGSRASELKNELDDLQRHVQTLEEGFHSGGWKRLPDSTTSHNRFNNLFFIHEKEQEGREDRETCPRPRLS
jgi:hypothetical protein